MIYTNKDNLEGKCTHREFYAQFVTDDTIKQVGKIFGDRLHSAKDNHFNSNSGFKLREWDRLWLTPNQINKVKSVGGTNTRSTKVCILKEAARQYVESK